jgi:hypothetical protein
MGGPDRCGERRGPHSGVGWQCCFRPARPGHQNCNRWQLERWNLNGDNTITAVYQGANFNYTVTFKQNGSCLTGTLTDSYIPAPGPQSGPISGTIRRNTVTFSFMYPTNAQGKRTHIGTISRRGDVSGRWSQTGTQVPDNGTWSPGTRANHACPRFWWWNQARVLRPQSLAHPEHPDRSRPTVPASVRPAGSPGGRHADRGIHPRRRRALRP